MLLSAASCVITIIAQKSAFAAIEHVPFQLRFANAVVSYVVYLWYNNYWLVNLTALYPYPGAELQWNHAGPSPWFFYGAFQSHFIFAEENTHLLLIGWLWFVGTMIPMIGLVQVGS